MDIKKRLDSIIKKDKTKNPQYLMDIIKSDLYYLLNNYFEVNFEDINVEINMQDEKYNIKASSLAERIKTMKILPE